MKTPARKGAASPRTFSLFAGLAYLVLGLFATKLFDTPEHAFYVWPASGVTLAALLLVPMASWAYPLIAIGLANLALSLAYGSSLGLALGFVASELAASALVATAARALDPEQQWLGSLRGTCVLIAAAVATALISSLLGATFLAFLAKADFWQEWRAWVIATSVGCLVITPVFLAWLGAQPKRFGAVPPSSVLIGLVFFLALLLSAATIFHADVADRFGGSVGIALTYLPMCFLVLIALVWDERGATLGALALATIAVVTTSQEEGPFAVTDAFVGEAALEVQGYIAAGALLTLLMSALRASQESALREAAAWKHRYDLAIAASRSLTYELDPESRCLTWSGDVERLLARNRADLDSLDAWLARVHADDRRFVESTLELLGKGEERSVELRYRVEGPRGFKYMEEEATAIVDEENKVYRVVGLMKEVRDTPVGDA